MKQSVKVGPSARSDAKKPSGRRIEGSGKRPPKVVVKDTSALFTHRSVERGVPSEVVRSTESAGLTREDIRMIIPDRTLERRLAKQEPLHLDEADALARLLRVVAQARDVFGNPALADEWLRSANPAFDGDVPIRMARTDLGGREVEAVLGRIAHGVFG